MTREMNFIGKSIVFTLGFSLLASCAKHDQSVITVTNQADFDRDNEVVEAPVKLVEGLAYQLYDADGHTVDYQLTADNSLLFPATVKAGSSSKYFFKGTAAADQPQATDEQADDAQPLEKAEAGCMAYTVRHDCQDDFAWENEHSGYRLYGPLFKRQWGNVHGYDIWCKRNPEPIVDSFYTLDHSPEHISYHKDHGKGFDGYTVGPTLGAGAVALMLDSTLCYPTAYDKYEIVDFGPMRIKVRFTVDSIPFGNDENGNPRYVTENRTLSLDRNAYLNKVTTAYEGIDSPTPIVAGIVIHKDNPEGYALISDSNVITVTDLSDNLSDGNGEIYIGAIIPGAQNLRFMPFDKVKANAVGQAIAEAQYTPGETFTYYWGSGWSKGSVADSTKWHDIMIDAKKRIDAPLIVETAHAE